MDHLQVPGKLRDKLLKSWIERKLVTYRIFQIYPSSTASKHNSKTKCIYVGNYFIQELANKSFPENRLPWKANHPIGRWLIFDDLSITKNLLLDRPQTTLLRHLGLGDQCPIFDICFSTPRGICLLLYFCTFVTIVHIDTCHGHICQR